ncbi:MAG: hypothetical protein J6Y42_01955, partial [Bacilli bacterium]|nr:hypothetical protein [Bacilli bacterium]
ITKNKLTQWETKINITLDKNEYQRKLNDIYAYLEKDFKAEFEDLTINKRYGDQNFDTYYNDVITYQKAVASIQEQINSGILTTYATMSEAEKALEEETLKLQEAIQKTKQQVKELWDNYLNGIDQVKSKLDLINKEYSRINDQLEYERQLIELVYGEKAYNKLKDFYEVQRAGNASQIASLQAQIKTFEEEFNDAMSRNGYSTIEEALQDAEINKLYNNWQDAQEELNNTILEGAKLIKEEYLNNLNDIFQTMDESIWGMSFDKMKSDWDYIQNKSKEYLDDITGVYKIQTLANKIDQAIINSNNLKYQQRLKEFENETIKYLREKENLTQTDLDIAEARYELLVKEYELEEARENKTSIKLARDASGNWSYQYVADEEKTLAKQQELSDAYNKLYETANNGYIHSLELTHQAYEDMQQQIQDLANSGELTAEKLKEIYEKYYQDYGVAANNAEIYRQEAATASSAHFDYLARMDANVYNGLTDLQKDLLDEVKTYCFVTYEDLRKQIQDTPLVNEVFEEFNHTAGSVADEVLKKWVGEEGSVQKGFSDAVKSIEDLVVWYNQTFEDFNTSIGGEESPLKTINTDLDELKSKFEPLTEATKNYCKNAGGYLDELRQGIQSTIEEYNKLNTAMGLDQDKDSQESKDDTDKKIEEPTPTGNKDGNVDNINKYTAEQITTIAQGIAGSIWYDNKRGSDTYNWGNEPVRQNKINELFNEAGEVIYKEVQAILKDYWNNVAKYDTHTEAYRNYDYAYLSVNPVKFASGGYTGNWDTSGKLAVLHEKELVLNADDTNNLLQAVNSIRDIARLNDSIDAAIATSIGRLTLDLMANAGTGASYNQVAAAADNTFYITAEFPNANDVETIKEAILSLPNIAAQYVNQR